ncbi:MAG TPA: carboxypeptidase-like regulatory domain-containing protein [Chitinophagales bacterium]|nr:carboxypeptidase-like regulatory domain-containing protein [Chitinophagales bacterium]
MAKQIRITIPQPCHQDWANMTPTQQGAFCHACQKNVIDFSVKTENEIYEIVSNSDSKICGRFNTFQLEQPIRKSEIANGFLNWRAIAAGFAALFSFNRVAANSDLETKPKIVAETKNELIDTATIVQPYKKPLQGLSKTVTDSDSVICIAGKVINAATNEPVPYAMLHLNGSLIGVVADISGNYSLEINRDEATKYGSLIGISSLGFDSRQIHLLEFMQTDYLVVKLIMNTESAIIFKSSSEFTAGFMMVQGDIKSTNVMRQDNYWELQNLKNQLDALRMRVSDSFKFGNER